MDIEVNISNITGRTPFDVYICLSDGSGCIYIKTINTTLDKFIIPKPYSNYNTFLLKIIDADNCTITGSATLI